MAIKLHLSQFCDFFESLVSVDLIDNFKVLWRIGDNQGIIVFFCYGNFLDEFVLFFILRTFKAGGGYDVDRDNAGSYTVVKLLHNLI